MLYWQQSQKKYVLLWKTSLLSKMWNIIKFLNVILCVILMITSIICPQDGTEAASPSALCGNLLLWLKEIVDQTQRKEHDDHQPPKHCQESYDWLHTQMYKAEYICNICHPLKIPSLLLAVLKYLQLMFLSHKCFLLKIANITALNVLFFCLSTLFAFSLLMHVFINRVSN